MKVKNISHLIKIADDLKQSIASIECLLLTKRGLVDEELKARLIGELKGFKFALAEVESIDIFKDSGEPWIYHGSWMIKDLLSL